MEDSGSMPNCNGSNYSSLTEDEELHTKESALQTGDKCSSWCAKINVTIEPVVCAFFLSTNLCDAVITNLYMSRVCETELHFNDTECSLLGSDTIEGHRVEALVQPYTTILLTAKSLLSSIVPAVLSLFWGPWSDYNGRKFLLLSPLLGLSMSLLLYAGLSYIPKLNAMYLLLASLPFSFCGGFINFISAAYSYMSDISAEENRALRLGLLETSLYIGVLIGLISSYHVFSMDKQYGYIITLSVGALVSLVAFLYTIFFVPESIERNEEVHSVRNVFQIKFLKEIFVTCFKPRENYGRALICMSLVVMTAAIIALEGEANLLYLFTRLRFGWDLQQFTVWSSVFIGIHFIGLLIGCVLLTKIFKISDIVLVITSYLTKFVECIFYCFIPRNLSYLMYWSQLIGILGGVSGPAIRSVASKLVPKEDVGKVFFLATACESLLPLAVTPIYTVIYNATFNVLPGAFFLLSSSFYFVSLIFCGFIWFFQRRVAALNYSHINEEAE